MKWINLFLALMLPALAFSGACSHEAPAPGADSSPMALHTQTPSRTYVYDCSGEFRFVVRIEGENAWLFLPGQTLMLPRVPSASGEKYRDGRTIFWQKGEEALLETVGTRYSACLNNPAMAVWEDATLRGVDFRAAGSRPAWYLEITAGDTIVFVTDDNGTRHDFRAPAPLVSKQEPMTVYTAPHDDRELTLVLEGRPCRDPITGESFESTVRVILDDRVYYGCGRALH